MLKRLLAATALMVMTACAHTVTATVVTGPNGQSECISFDPPVQISGMVCTGECAAKDAAGVWTWAVNCTQSTTNGIVQKQIILRQ